MARTKSAAQDSDEDMGLLANSNSSGTGMTEVTGLAGLAGSGDEGDDLVVHTGGGAVANGVGISGSNGSSGSIGGGLAASALRSPLTPRTPNRVRFDLTPTLVDPPPTRASRDSQDSQDGRDGRYSFFDVDRAPETGRRHPLRQQRFPLLAEDDDEDDGPYTGGVGDDDEEDEDYASGRRRGGGGSGGGSGWPGARLDTDGDVTDAEQWAAQERRRPKSGLGSAFMNMANSIIGAGIIGQPYALRQAGLVAGVVLLVGLTAVVDWTIRLIVINSKLSGASSFQGTVEHCFGRPGLVAISLAQWVFAFGGMVAFGVIVGDSIPHVLAAVWPGLREMPVLGLLADRRAVIVVCLLAVSYPLTLYRDIAKLAKASTFALVSMIVIIVTVLVQGAMVPAADRGSFSTPLLTINTGFFQAIGVISFAFVCHHNSLLIYGSLKTPTMDRFARVTHVSTGVSMVACLLMALAGFLTFGDRTLGNVLNNFSADNTMVNVARLCFGLNMLTTLPLEAFVCREVMFNYYMPGAPFNRRLHVLVSTSLLIGAMTLSVTTCDLGTIFELVGATSACAMAYILPPLCYIKLTTRSWRTYLAWAIVVFGCTVMVISLLQAVGKMIHNDGSTAHCH